MPVPLMHCISVCTGLMLNNNNSAISVQCSNVPCVSWKAEVPSYFYVFLWSLLNVPVDHCYNTCINVWTVLSMLLQHV